MSIESQIQARENLIFQNLGRIEANVRKARRGTTEEVAALVLDARDERARAMIAFADRPAELEALLAEAARWGVVPAVVASMPRRVVTAVVRDHFPELADAAARLDTDGGYLVFSVAGGGAVAMVVRPGDVLVGRPLVRAIIP